MGLPPELRLNCYGDYSRSVCNGFVTVCCRNGQEFISEFSSLTEILLKLQFRLTAKQQKTNGGAIRR